MSTSGASVTGVSSLFGRDVELGVLDRLLEEARSGRGGTVVMTGEAGIGKTRLVDEAMERARSTCMAVAAGASDEAEPDRPFAPFVEALGLDERGGGDHGPLSRLISGADDPPRPLASGAGHGDLGRVIGESIVAQVEQGAAATPMLVVVEDLHWADPATLRVLPTLARVARQLPLALIATTRPFPRPAGLGKALADLAAAGAHTLAIPPLNPADAGRLAAEAAGRDLAAAWVATAAGNPLLVLELARSQAEVSDRAPEPERPSDVAATVRRAVVARLGDLPAPTREILAVASVLGRRFRVDLLAAVTGRPAAHLLAALGDALAAQILGEEGDDLAFRHDLVRHAVYGEVSQALRAGLHRQAARVLREGGFPALQVAEHLVAGAAPGDGEAVAWLAEAALVAAPRAPDTAVKLLTHASRLAGPTGPQADALAAELAPLLVQIGLGDEAEQLVRQVLDRGPVPSVEVALHRGLAHVLWGRGWIEPATARLRAAADVTGVAPAAAAGARGLAGYLAMFLGQPGPGAALARAALADGEEYGDDFARGVALQALAVAAAADARTEDALTLAARAVAVAAATADPAVGLLQHHLTLGLVQLDADRFDEAEATLQEGLARSEARGAVAWLPLFHCILAMRRILSGDWDDGLAEVDTGLALSDEIGTRLHVPFLRGMAAWTAVHRGDVPAARAHMDEAVREFLLATTDVWQAEASDGLAFASPRWPLEWGLWIGAHIEEAAGDGEAALAYARSAWAAATPLRFFLGYRLFGPDLVRLATRAGDRALATDVAGEVAEGARRSGVAGASAAAMRCLGLANGDARMLASAAEAYASTPRVTERAFTAEEAGDALAREGQRDDAVVHLEVALELYERFGAAHPAARAQASLRALGVRRRRPRREGPGTGWGGLTPTEARVATLAAEGLTNRQIGERLFVSPRTVETHLGHCFAKLAVTTRSQLAAEVVRHR